MEASLASEHVIGNILGAVLMFEPTFSHRLLLSYEMVKLQRGLGEWRHEVLTRSTKHLEDTEHFSFISWLGERHKALQITTDYKPLGEAPEIRGFDAASAPLPPSSHPSTTI